MQIKTTNLTKDSTCQGRWAVGFVSPFKLKYLLTMLAKYAMSQYVNLKSDSRLYIKKTCTCPTLLLDRPIHIMQIKTTYPTKDSTCQGRWTVGFGSPLKFIYLRCWQNMHYLSL